MSDEVADVLAGTREYIEKNGWWRGNLVGPNGRQVCVMGGLMKTMGLHSQHQLTFSFEGSEAMQAIMRVVIARGGQHLFGSVMDWNDDKKDGAKDKQDVLDVLAKAEKIERAGYDPDA